ncbi:Uu.00g066540.m01.CDS01 [Anthostomella pinea]|uniref:Uu.00g066540.m01.CDS01 n=1 Tax=Anthostomella pinea TaxID=933095 RepID=A0AAI8YN64_9PEZI|nr:Uu.00g066540.m01.CDS01 [Anthostomella pinea]
MDATIMNLPNMAPERVVALTIDIATFQRIQATGMNANDDLEMCNQIAMIDIRMAMVDESIKEAAEKLQDVAGYQVLVNLRERKTILENLMEALDKMRSDVEGEVSEQASRHRDAAGQADEDAAEDSAEDSDADTEEDSDTDTEEDTEEHEDEDAEEDSDTDTEEDTAEDEDEDADETAVFTCALCGATHARLATHRQHHRMRHVGLTCIYPNCGSTTATEEQMRGHIETSHINSTIVVVNGQERFVYPSSTTRRPLESVDRLAETASKTVNLVDLGSMGSQLRESFFVLRE